jgi:hypothetical protein
MGWGQLGPAGPQTSNPFCSAASTLEHTSIKLLVFSLLCVNPSLVVAPLLLMNVIVIVVLVLSLLL